MHTTVWRSLASVALLLLLLGFHNNVRSLESPGGDLAPLGAADGQLNAGDAVVLQRLINGNLIPTPQQALIADVAPLGYPDGILNAGDYLVLLRAILGEVSLAPVYIGPAAPVLDGLSSPTNNNPVLITGAAELGVDINLYVAGELQTTAIASAVDGTFSIPVALADGDNTIYLTASNTGIEGGTSNTLNVEYINTVPRNQSGTLAQDTVWTPGLGNDPYIIGTDLTIAAGATLTLQPGTRLQFDSGTGLIVDGGLRILGSPSTPVVLTSNGATTNGAWEGIVIHPASNISFIDFVRIEYATTGIDVQSSTLNISNSEISNFSAEGIRVSNTTAGTIKNNTITNPSLNGTGIYLDQASPTISGNRITSLIRGIHISAGSNPNVTNGNIIVSNDTGVSVTGNNNIADDPDPVISGNSLFNNTNSNMRASSSTFGSEHHTINATGNWWGTADPDLIYQGIVDKGKDNYNSSVNYIGAMIDWRGYLDSEDGEPVPGTQFSGFVATPTVLDSSTPINVLGSIYVLPGATLTISAGTTLNFYNNRSVLRVYGRLEINGEQGLPVTMTSGKADSEKTAGDWRGLIVNGDQGIAIIDNAVIEYAKTGIEFYDGDGRVSNSLIQYNTRGFDIFGTRYANELYVSPTISGNTISNNNDGIYLRDRAAPIITGGNSITNNNKGIYAYIPIAF